MLASLRASIIGRGNPFFRYHKGFFKNRADFTESELAKSVEKQVDKNTNKWQGIVCLYYALLGPYLTILDP